MEEALALPLLSLYRTKISCKLLHPKYMALLHTPSTNMLKIIISLGWLVLKLTAEIILKVLFEASIIQEDLLTVVLRNFINCTAPNLNLQKSRESVFADRNMARTETSWHY